MREIDRWPYLYRLTSIPDKKCGDAEYLYRRVHPDHFTNGSPNLTRAISFPDTSVNRGLLSTPKDTLLRNSVSEPRTKNKGHAVIGFQVKDVPKNIDGNQFDVVHDPVWNNYSHSEIRTFQQEDSGEWQHTRRKPPKGVRLKFREMLSDRATVVIQAREDSSLTKSDS